MKRVDTSFIRHRHPDAEQNHVCNIWVSTHSQEGRRFVCPDDIVLGPELYDAEHRSQCRLRGNISPGYLCDWGFGLVGCVGFSVAVPIRQLPFGPPPDGRSRAYINR